MGYDGTLHLVDERSIKEELVSSSPRLLGKSRNALAFEKRKSGAVALQYARKALETADAREAPSHPSPQRPMPVPKLLSTPSLIEGELLTKVSPADVCASSRIRVRAGHDDSRDLQSIRPYDAKGRLIHDADSNLVFSVWGRIFKNPMTTAAAVDRLVHDATILEFAPMKTFRSPIGSTATAELPDPANRAADDNYPLAAEPGSDDNYPTSKMVPGPGSDGRLDRLRGWGSRRQVARVQTGCRRFSRFDFPKRSLRSSAYKRRLPVLVPRAPVSLRSQRNIDRPIDTQALRAQCVALRPWSCATHLY